MSSSYYDRYGKPIDLMAWAKLHNNAKYKIVQQDRVLDMFLSTVWLGLDHSFGSGPPLIFETMLFNAGEEEYCERYSTLEEAKVGHTKKLGELQ